MGKPTFLNAKPEPECGCGCGNCKQGVEGLPPMKGELSIIKSILFGDRVRNKPVSCCQVGLLGCIKIEELEEVDDGSNVPCFSYLVHFANGEMYEVINAIYVISE